MAVTAQLDPVVIPRPFPGLGSWNIRRTFMFVVAFFDMGVISYCLYRGDDTRIAETAIEMCSASLTLIVGTYVFGAVWENTSAYRTHRAYDSGYGGGERSYSRVREEVTSTAAAAPAAPAVATREEVDGI